MTPFLLFLYFVAIASGLAVLALIAIPVALAWLWFAGTITAPTKDGKE